MEYAKELRVRRYSNGVSVKIKNRRVVVGQPKGMPEGYNVIEFKRLLPEEERDGNRKHAISTRQGPLLITVLALDDLGITTLYETLTEYIAHRRQQEIQKELESTQDDIRDLKEAIKRNKKKKEVYKPKSKKK